MFENQSGLINKIEFTEQVVILYIFAGVVHTDDLFYLFPSKYGPPSNLTGDDQKMVEKMVSLWTNFSIYG